MEQISICLPLPSRTLHPNSRSHWRTKSVATKSHREAAFVLFKISRQNKEPWACATISLEFTFPDKRRRDIDGLISSCKAYFDGLTDSGIIIDDSGIQGFSVKVLPADKLKPGVKITVTKTE